MIDYGALGRRIKAARKKRQLTQMQLAELAGMEPNNLSHIERGLSKGSVQSLVNIATSLSVTLDSLLADSLPEERDFYLGEISLELQSCSPQELRVVETTVKSLIESLHKQYQPQQDD